MSFSSTVKNELCRHENRNDCCSLSELAAAISLNGAVTAAPDNGVNIRITTENAAFARRVYSQIKKLLGIYPEVTIRKSRKLKKHVSYIIVVTSGLGASRLLEKTGTDAARPGGGEASGHVLPGRRSVKRACCRKAFLRGAFLAGGSVSDPEKTYHLELTSRSRALALELSRLLGTFRLNARIVRRKGSYVTYLKEGENIVDFLNIIGAHAALLELENVRILKGMRNNVNRIVNCETANLEKTVNASVRQVENIKYIMENMDPAALPESLREIAELRLACGDANLAELGQMLDPPLGKSGVNHRLRKLDSIAEEHRKLNGRA